VDRPPVILFGGEGKSRQIGHHPALRLASVNQASSLGGPKESAAARANPLTHYGRRALKLKLKHDPQPPHLVFYDLSADPVTMPSLITFVDRP
jgi:hypothetical protein